MEPTATTEEILDDNDEKIDKQLYVIYMPEIERKIMGGNMRLGLKTTCIKNEDSLAYRIYRSQLIEERHRHRYEVNPNKIAELEQAGLHFSGKDKTD